mmetsp:Transcript_16092/g.16096  ORF Transcript_16092/g.16096 Transcript_16092/m.16096 type:complete len:453 (+) Transcript_16092:23-1381(+)
MLPSLLLRSSAFLSCRQRVFTIATTATTTRLTSRRQHDNNEIKSPRNNPASYRPPFNDISQLPSSSSSILKQKDHELSMNELKLKLSLNKYLQELKMTTTNDNQENITNNDDEDNDEDEDDRKQHYMYLLDELQRAYMDVEYWEEALKIEKYKCCAYFYFDTDGYADSIHAQGKLYLRQQDFINSKRLYEEALTYFEAKNNLIQQGHVLISLAGWYFFQSNNSDGDDQLNKALDCLKQSESMLNLNPVLLVKCLDNQGLIYRLLGEFRIALNKYQQALQVVVDKETRSALKMHIADMLVALEEPTEALSIYQDLFMEISGTTSTTLSTHKEQQQQDLGMCGVLLHNIASIYVEQGEHELALEKFLEALEMKQIAGGEHNLELAKTLNALGAIYAGILDDKLRALEYFKQVLLITRIHANTDDDNNNDNMDIMNTLQNISLMEQDLYGERKSK